MREMKPDTDEPKKKSEVPKEIDLPLGELKAQEPPEITALESEEELYREENSQEDMFPGEEFVELAEARRRAEMAVKKEMEDAENETAEELTADTNGNDTEGEESSDTADATDTSDTAADSPAATQDDDAPTEEDLEEERAYEARRAARAERLHKRKRRQRRRRALLAGFTTAAVVVLAAGFYFGDEFMDKLQNMERMIAENRKTREEERAAKEAAAQAKNNPTPEVTQEPEKPMTDEKTLEENKAIRAAKRYAQQYDYDKAIEAVKSNRLYSTSDRLKKYAAKYEKKKSTCVAWPLEEVTHVFYHSLVVDPSRAFDGDYKSDGFNQVMTTIDEFNKITQSMYEKGYVMVSLKDIATVDENGKMIPGEILLPPGKIPFVLSQDDVCYYHFMEGNGFASKLVLDENGKVKNEYVDGEGNVSIGDYDMVPLIDSFVKQYPDFSYRGAKGILALTGYDGILGYRTDISYQEIPKDIDTDKLEWLNANPDFSLEAERAEAKKVADALKKSGWEFASHTWGHLNVADVSLERLQRDTAKFKENVDPLIGGTDMIIFAFGADFVQGEEYYGDKYEFYKSQGYNYFCNVDSQKYFVQLRDNYLRMGRRNLDGYRMYYNPDMVADLFDAGSVFDQNRPVPVPPMG